MSNFPAVKLKGRMHVPPGKMQWLFGPDLKDTTPGQHWMGIRLPQSKIQ